jgi:hypothetical protein
MSSSDVYRQAVTGAYLIALILLYREPSGEVLILSILRMSKSQYITISCKDLENILYEGVISVLSAIQSDISTLSGMVQGHTHAVWELDLSKTYAATSPYDASKDTGPISHSTLSNTNTEIYTKPPDPRV